MHWKICLIGEEPIGFDADNLKEAIRQFSTRREIPKNGYLIVSGQGLSEFQLTITAGVIFYNGELLFGNPDSISKAEVEKQVSFNKSQSEATLKDFSADIGPPPLAVLFFMLAIASFLGGTILCIALWPPEPGYGKSWELPKYIPSIVSLTAGIVQFALYGAIAQCLYYLKKIVVNTSANRVD